MKNILLLILILTSTSSFACQCIDSFYETLNYQKKGVVSKYLNIDENQIESIKTLNVKERDTRLVGALKIILFPLVLTAGECEKSCMKYVKEAGKVTFLVKYKNHDQQFCQKVIRVKGRLSLYGELKLRNKFVSFGEFCQKDGE